MTPWEKLLKTIENLQNQAEAQLVLNALIAYFEGERDKEEKSHQEVLERIKKL